MKLEILNDLSNLINNNSFTEKLSLIDKLVELKKYKDAYFKLAVILEFINLSFSIKVLNIDLKNSTIITFCNTYLKYDEKLANKMLAINAEYNLTSEDISSIGIDDVEYLAASIYDIYEYMITNYKTFL